ncbi:MAG TPA: DUF2079 domain-containing protein [Jatrophihabitantaceae bacterium]|nr:DUF2079 domain-containing protein [Jatrophihabitantaceae bacterium]
MASGLVVDGDEPAAAPSTAPAGPTGHRSRLPSAALAVVTAGCLAFYLVHSFVDQHRYLTTGYDLGIFDQAVRAYSHFQAPMVPLKGADYNIFGDHFHPIIAVLAPFYWIWDDVGVLFIAQALLLAASVPVVYRFARRRTGESMSLIVAATYGFGWPLQGLVDFDFHEIAFATPLAALAIDALDRRDDRRLVLWCALLLLVREDMGLIVALIGALLIAQRRGQHRLGIGMIAVGAFTYWLTTSVIIPHFSAGHGFAYDDQFGALGDSVTAAIGNIVTHPWHAANVFFTPYVKTKTLLLLLVPFAFVPLRSPYALLALPLFAERFFNSRHNLWTATFHYNALPWLILTLAMVDGAGRFGFFDTTRRATLFRRGLAIVLIATPLVLIVFGDRWRVVPVTDFRKPYANQPAGWRASAAAVVTWLPKDVCVAADNHLVPHLTNRDWTTVAQADTPDPDFYAIDIFAPDTGGNPPAPKPDDVYNAALKAGYKQVFISGTFVVLQSPNYRGPSHACTPTGPGKSG